jgi:hypothetical protein
MAASLHSSLVDTYFRQFNGHNADLRGVHSAWLVDSKEMNGGPRSSRALKLRTRNLGSARNYDGEHLAGRGDAGYRLRIRLAQGGTRTMHHRQARIFVWAPLVPLMFVTLFACGGPNTSDGVTSGESDAASVPKEALSWDALLGVRLRSVRTYGGGLGPDGQLQEYKYLELSRDGSFELLTADMSLRGTYRREGDRLIARAEGQDFTGEIDLSRGVLTLDGIEFELP